MWDTDEERNLACEEAKHGCSEYFQIVLPVDFFLRKKHGYKPEQSACTYGSKAEDGNRGNQMSAGQVLADNDIESEDGICDKTGCVTYDGIFSEHIFLSKDGKVTLKYYICIDLTGNV